jgi:His-Xaa-Ser system protein HxsD
MGTAVSRDIAVSSAVYSLDTVKKAAYRFIDRFALDLCLQGEQIQCTLTFAPATSETVADAILQDFKRELLDQDLRQSIAKETAPLRNTILALAFAQSNTQRE